MGEVDFFEEEKKYFRLFFFLAYLRKCGGRWPLGGSKEARKPIFMVQHAQTGGLLLSEIDKTAKVKKTEKKFKKGVDKVGRRWYNIQAVAESGAERCRLKRAGSLKIEQQASYKSTKVDVYRDSEILLKNIKKTLNK